VTPAPPSGSAAGASPGTTGLLVSRLGFGVSRLGFGDSRVDGIPRWAPLPEVRPVYEAIRRLRSPRP
jgi:hypothetical protein